VSSSSGSSNGGDGAAAAACFVDAVGQPAGGALVWVLVIFTIVMVVSHWRKAQGTRRTAKKA
jgi:hypothetical protein